MQLEEFIKLGCLQCGMHEFSSTGPIEHDGPTEVTCSLCGFEIDRDTWGNLDSLAWEKQRAGYEGTTPPPETRTEYYENEEQFVDAFEKAVTPGPEKGD